MRRTGLRPTSAEVNLGCVRSVDPLAQLRTPGVARLKPSGVHWENIHKGRERHLRQTGNPWSFERDASSTTDSGMRCPGRVELSLTPAIMGFLGSLLDRWLGTCAGLRDRRSSSSRWCYVVWKMFIAVPARTWSARGRAPRPPRPDRRTRPEVPR